MLSTPSAGWVNITLDNWTDRASYLTEVHFNIMDSLITYLNKRKSQTVYCDAEGREYFIVFDWGVTYIIEETDSARLITIEKNIIDIAKEAYEDISKDVDAWANWDLDGDKEKIKKNKEKIKRKLKTLKKAIEQYGE